MLTKSYIGLRANVTNETQNAVCKKTVDISRQVKITRSTSKKTVHKDIHSKSENEVWLK